MKINFDKDKGKFMRFFKELFRDIKKEIIGCKKGWFGLIAKHFGFLWIGLLLS